jgi:E3 ubiquitin-protein ligase synoviolin
MFGLQRLFYGPLRPIEIEQLYEKAWFAITETCLAMTIFREEVGAWFLVMFVALLAGKVWGWIGDGRVEILEQQPPADPRLFHIRLTLSLALSLVYDLTMLAYSVNTVIQQARPNMMVMFLFEFAILTITSVSTALRYCISLIEERIVKKQTKERLEAARAAVRAEREEILRQRAAAEQRDEVPEEGGEAPEEPLPALPSEDDVDEMDIEVPGWEVKGHYVLSLDLLTGMLLNIRDRRTLLTRLRRFLQTCHLLDLFLHPSHILRPTDPYYARPVHNSTVICQASYSIYQISSSHE